MTKEAVISHRWPRDAPYYECPKNFRESLATFPDIVNGLLLRSIVLKCVQNLKSVALSVPLR